MMIGWGWASWGETFTRFLPHTPSSNAPSPPSAGRRHRDCRRTVRRTPIRSLPPTCPIGRYPPSRPLLSPDVFPQRVLLVFRRLVLPFFVLFPQPALSADTLHRGLSCHPMYFPSGSCSSLGGSSSRSSITHTSRSHIPHHLHCFQRSLDRPFSPWPRRLQISNSSRMITARSSARSRCV